MTQPPHHRNETTVIQIAGAVLGSLVATMITSVLLVYFFPVQAQAMVDGTVAVVQSVNQIVYNFLEMVFGEIPDGSSQSDPDLLDPESWEASREPPGWDFIVFMFGLAILWIAVGAAHPYLTGNSDDEGQGRRP